MCVVWLRAVLNHSGAELVLERRLRLPSRWWEAAGTDAAEAAAGLRSGPTVCDDDGDIATMDKSSTGVIEVYIIRAPAASSATGEPVGEQGRGTGDDYSDSSDDELTLFS